MSGLKAVCLLALTLNLLAIEGSAHISFEWVRLSGGADDALGCSIQAVDVDRLGNACCAGYFHSCDVFLCKYDNNGGEQWRQALEGLGKGEADDVVVDAQGNIFVSGITNEFMGSSVGEIAAEQAPTAPHATGNFLCEFSPAGELLWARMWPGFRFIPSAIIEYGINMPCSLALDSAGNVFAAGDSSSCLGSPEDELSAFVRKVDSDGNLLWHRELKHLAVYDIATDDHGSIWAVGGFRGNVALDTDSSQSSITSAGRADAFVLTISEDGSLESASSWGGEEDEEAVAIATAESGTVCVAGTFAGSVDFDTGPDTLVRTTQSYPGIFVSSFDASGNFRWVNTVDGPDSSFSYFCNNVHIDQSGRIYIAGWSRQIVPFMPESPPRRASALFTGIVRRMSPDGNTEWTEYWGGPEWCKIGGVHTDSFGHIWVCGDLWGDVDFDPGPQAQVQSSQLGYDGFLLKLRM